MARKFWLAVGFLCLSWAPAAAQEGVLSELYGKGVHAYFANRPWVALEHFNSVLDNGSNDPRAHYFRGLTYLQLGDQGSADKDFRAAATLETADSNEFYDVSRALERIQGRQRLAIESYRTNGRLEALKRAKQLEYERYERIRTSEPNVTIPPEEAPPAEALPEEPASEPAEEPAAPGAAPVQDPFAEEPATKEPAADEPADPAMEEEATPEPAAEETPVEEPVAEPTTTEEPPAVEEPAADPAAVEPDAAGPAATEPAALEPDAVEPDAAGATEELAPDEATPAEEPAADAAEPAADAAGPAADEMPAAEPAEEATEEPAAEAAPAKASAAVKQPAQRRATNVPLAKASQQRVPLSRKESTPVKSARADRLSRDLAWLRGIKLGVRK